MHTIRLVPYDHQPSSSAAETSIAVHAEKKSLEFHEWLSTLGLDKYHDALKERGYAIASSLP